MRGRNIIQINTSITESFRDKGNSSDLCIQRQMPKQFDSDAADKRGAEGWNMQGKQCYIILVDGLPEEQHPHCHPKGQQDKTRLDIAIYMYIYILLLLGSRPAEQSWGKL